MLHKTTRATHLSNPSFEHPIAFGSNSMRINNKRNGNMVWNAKIILHSTIFTLNEKKTEVNIHIAALMLIMDRFLSVSISGRRI